MELDKKTLHPFFLFVVLVVAVSIFVPKLDVYAAGGAGCQAVGGGCSDLMDCTTSGGASQGAMDCINPTICCKKGQNISVPDAQAGQQSVSNPDSAKPASLQLQLQPCVKDGNCTVDDVVRQGASFANLLTTLSAALFFATFVYGGAMYVLSFGDKGRVDKGKKAMTGAAIGMAIVLGAWTLVNYVAKSLLGKI